jgi:hypothetical protein
MLTPRKPIRTIMPPVVHPPTGSRPSDEFPATNPQPAPADLDAALDREIYRATKMQPCKGCGK